MTKRIDLKNIIDLDSNTKEKLLEEIPPNTLAQQLLG